MTYFVEVRIPEHRSSFVADATGSRWESCVVDADYVAAAIDLAFVRHPEAIAARLWGIETSRIEWEQRLRERAHLPYRR